MPCYHPIPARITSNFGYGSRTLNKKTVEIHPKVGEPTHWLPCQKCLGCREMQQQELALRVKHEAASHDHKHFLTFTYDEETRPDGLRKADMKKFWKRLRKNTLAKIKYLECGEYGDRTQRPHYHAAVLGLEIPDQKKWDSTNNTSEMLTKTWKNGIVTVSELTEDRIKYVAGYVLKKAGYKKQIYCTEDGEDLEAPYRHMSKGLGENWIRKFASDARNGYILDNGAKYSIPRYYKDKIKSTSKELDEYIEKQKAKNKKELTPEDRRLLHNAEKIRQKEIRERLREQI